MFNQLYPTTLLTSYQSSVLLIINLIPLLLSQVSPRELSVRGAGSFDQAMISMDADTLTAFVCAKSRADITKGVAEEARMLKAWRFFE